MRVFIALDLSDATRAAMAGVQRRVAAEVARVASGARITWVQPDRLHLTLRFFANATEAEVQTLRAALASPLGVPAAEVIWGGLGVFPPRGTPRVIWVGIECGADAVEEMAAVLDARLADAGIAREARPFSPHLTLGRVREGMRWRWPDLAGERAVAHDTIGHLTLYESRLSASGPTYTALAQGRAE